MKTEFPLILIGAGSGSGINEVTSEQLAGHALALFCSAPISLLFENADC